MTIVHHINCGSLEPIPGVRIACHCLLLEDPAGLALVDAGIGLLDRGRLPRERVEQFGFRFDADDTAAAYVASLGRARDDVRHIVMTHLDPDHAGGLADFPAAEIHVSAEERESLRRGSWRYEPSQFAHGPRWRAYGGEAPVDWYGLAARLVPLGLESDVLLVPLPGHTMGHCGVAVGRGGRWDLHVGDAYYLRVETTTDDHPVSERSAAAAEDDALRRASLDEIRRLMRAHGDAVRVVGYHDPTELPRHIRW